MKFNLRQSNAGHWIGLGIALCVILIIVAFFKLTWGFWHNLYMVALEPSLASLKGP